MNPRQRGRRLRIEVRDSGYVDEWFEMFVSDAELEALRQRAQLQRELKKGPQFDPVSATWRWGDVEITEEYLVRERDRVMRNYQRPTYHGGYDDIFSRRFQDDAKRAADAAREAAEQLKREQDERLRKAREAAKEKLQREAEERKRKAQEEARRQQEEYIRSFFDKRGNFNFTFGGSNTGGTGSSRPKPPPSQPTSTTDALKHLARLAGVEWSEAQKLSAGQLYRKAQRKCHPDTGGTHERWIEMQRYGRALGLE